jgi:uncharacterized membrane protein
VISRSRVMHVLEASLALSLVASLLYAITASSVLLYLAWGLLVPAPVCFYLLTTVRSLRYPARRVRVRHRYYSYREDGRAVFEDAREKWG